MFTATFIAKKGGLEPALVASVQSAWGGGDAVWLAPDEAAEFESDAHPSKSLGGLVRSSGYGR